MVNLDFVLFSGNELPDDFVGSFIQQGQYYGEEKRFVQCVVAKPLLAGTITTTTKVVFQRVISNISESRINLARTKSRICDAQCVPIGAWFDNNQKTSPSSRPDRLQFCSNDCSFTAYASHQFLARFGLLDGDLIRIVSHGSRIIQLRYRIDIQDEFLHLERMLFWNIFAGTELECEAIEFKLYDIQNMDMLPTAKSVQLSIIASPYSTDKSYLALALDGLENALDRRFIYLNDLIEVRIGVIHAQIKKELPSFTSDTSFLSRCDTQFASVFFKVSGIDGINGCRIDIESTKVTQKGTLMGPPPPLIKSTLGKTCTRVSQLLALSKSDNYQFPIVSLIHGKRGTGKTSTIQEATNHSGFHLFTIDGYTLLNETILESVAYLQLIFDKAAKSPPSALLLRHSPSLIIHPEVRNCIFEFMKTPKKVVIICTAEEIGQLEPIISMFSHTIEHTVSDESSRSLFFEANKQHLYPDSDLKTAVRDSAGFGVADLANCLAMGYVNAKERSAAYLKEEIFNSASYEEVDADDKKAVISSNTGLVDKNIDTLLENSGILIDKRDLSKALEKSRKLMSVMLGAPKIPNIQWDDIGGLSHVKEAILDTIQLPLARPELFANGLKRRSGCLLYGPPGTGKTLVAKAVATTLGLNFFSVKGPELLNMYIGESERNVRLVFEKAAECKPCIIFFDEIDSIAPKRGEKSDSGGVMDRIVSQLLAELDSIGATVFVIGATNRPDLIDPSLLRPGRFETLLYLGVCDTREAQLGILKALTRKFSLDATLDIEMVASMCPFTYTGADFYALCADAQLSAMTRTIAQLEASIEGFNMNRTEPATRQWYMENIADEQAQSVIVDLQDFEEAVRALQPSVSASELQRYKTLRQQYQAK